jgi:hypothetical protein
VFRKLNALALFSVPLLLGARIELPAPARKTIDLEGGSRKTASERQSKIVRSLWIVC